MNTIEIHVKFNGMYSNGQGFNSVLAANEWNNFFNNYHGIFWKALVDELGSVYLVSVHMGGMIHPMDGATFIGPAFSYMNNYDSEIAELKKICKIICEKCGGTYELIYN